MSNFYCLIPARLKSSRFPNKMLKLIHDKPLIQYVYDKCLKSKIFKKVLVATCDKEIYNIIIDNNGHSIMTSITHKGCISRVAEAVKKIREIKNNDFICIVQGDEVMVDHKILDSFCSYVSKVETNEVFNALSKIKDDKEYKSKSVIKAVVNNSKNIMNLSRIQLTNEIKKFNKEISNKVLRQTGVIMIRKDYLIKYSKFKRSFFEKKESIDMLRYLENDIAIKAFLIKKTMIGIDTPKDYQKFLKN